MWKREGLFSVSMVSLLLISGMIALISIPEDILPFNLTIDVSASFSGGNGTASNPYQISDVTQLQNMSVNLTANYILINDINASATIYWNSGKGFDPIGDSSNRFSGSLDGQNYNITDLFINRPSESYVGLIGATKGATITYVSLIDVKVSGDWDVGGLVGENRYGTVSNCFASGNVSGYFDVGGLVGDNRYGTVSNCSATGTVSGGYEYIGGLVGENYDGTVSNCFASGTVSGGYFDVGGLMGGNTYGTVSNCSATGNVSGDDYIGGLVGENYHGTVSNCYAIGTVSGNEDVGGLVGENRFGTVSNSYYCINYTFINNQKYVTPYGIYEHQFNAWINSNKSLDIDDYLFFNSSTGYYNISNIPDIKNMLPFAASGNFQFKQTVDIDLSSEPGFYMPLMIGGIFDGNGHTISDLNITFFNNNEMGMFGYIGSGVFLRNISLIDVNVSGDWDVGGLVGENYYGTVSNCYATGNVSGDDYVGGLVGENYYGTVSNCYATGTVSGGSHVGGLVGENYDGTVSNCYVTGAVSGGDDYVGGLVGENRFGTVSNSFWDTQTSGLYTSAGGTGKITNQMKTKSTFTSFGWDFVSTWCMLENITYPKLRAFLDDEVKLTFGLDSTPLNGTTGDQLTFSINASDNTDYLSVYVEYWFGTRSHSNVSMNGTGPYTFTITIPSNSTSTLHYIFHAKNILGNWRENPQRNVTITDNDRPWFVADTTTLYGTTGDPFQFEFEIRDNIDIGEGWVEYWFGEEDHMNRSMNGSGPFNLSLIIPYDSIVDLSYVFHFNDMSGNWNQTRGRNVTIIDNDIPIFIADLTPDNPTTGGEITIAIDVFDNIGLDVVCVSYSFVEEELYRKGEMTLNGDRYYVTLSIPVNSTKLRYVIIATDISDLINSTSLNTIRIVDNISPELGNVEDITTYVGLPLNLTVGATDNIGITSISWDGNPVLSEGLSLIGTPSQSGVFTVTMAVFDLIGNSAEITFEITILPEDHDSDGDGIPDLVEIANGLDMNDSNDASLDPDNDGLTNLEEYLNGTKMNDEDSDDDGMPDGWEVKNGLDALTPSADNDADGDGKTDLDEYLDGTDPNVSEENDGGLSWAVLIALFLVVVLLLGLGVFIYLKRRKNVEEPLEVEEQDVDPVESDDLEGNIQEEHVKLEVPDKDVLADLNPEVDQNIPIEEPPQEQPQPIEAVFHDQVVQDPDPVPFVETPNEEQISEDIPLASSEQTSQVEDLSTDIGPLLTI